jgi:hypothetical protein
MAPLFSLAVTPAVSPIQSASLCHPRTLAGLAELISQPGLAFLTAFDEPASQSSSARTAMRSSALLPNPTLLGRVTDRQFRCFVDDMLQLLTRDPQQQQILQKIWKQHTTLPPGSLSSPQSLV